MHEHLSQAFGRFFYGSGHKALSGQILGLLLSQPEHAWSLDDVANELRVSKGPVSQCMRDLRNKALVRKIYAPAGRRQYYRLADDVWLALARLFLTPLRELCTLAAEIEKQRSSPAPAMQAQIDGVRQAVGRLEKVLGVSPA